MIPSLAATSAKSRCSTDSRNSFGFRTCSHAFKNTAKLVLLVASIAHSLHRMICFIQSKLKGLFTFSKRITSGPSLKQRGKVRFSTSSRLWICFRRKDGFFLLFQRQKTKHFNSSKSTLVPHSNGLKFF